MAISRSKFSQPGGSSLLAPFLFSSITKYHLSSRLALLLRIGKSIANSTCSKNIDFHTKVSLFHAIRQHCAVAESDEVFRASRAIFSGPTSRLLAFLWLRHDSAIRTFGRKTMTTVSTLDYANHRVDRDLQDGYAQEEKGFYMQTLVR